MFVNLAKIISGVLVLELMLGASSTADAFGLKCNGTCGSLRRLVMVCRKNGFMNSADLVWYCS